MIFLKRSRILHYTLLYKMKSLPNKNIIKSIIASNTEKCSFKTMLRLHYSKYLKYLNI